MKTALRSVVTIAALCLAAKAAPFLAMGDSAELFITGTLGIRADDNVLLAANKTSDVIFETSPALYLVYGNNSLTKGHLFYKENINSYIDRDDLNTTLSSVGFTVPMTTRRPR